MASVVSASTATHWDLNGKDYPKGWTVGPFQLNDALLKKGGYRPLRIPLGSVVAGATPATQDALIAALSPIVAGESSGGGGGASASDIANAIAGRTLTVAGDLGVEFPSSMTVTGTATAAAIANEIANKTLNVAGSFSGGASAADIASANNTALKATAQPTRQSTTNANILTKLTSATPGAWVSFDVAPANRIDFQNRTGVDIEYYRTDPTKVIVVPNKFGRVIDIVANASEIRFRRVDQQSGQVLLTAEALL